MIKNICITDCKTAEDVNKICNMCDSTYDDTYSQKGVNAYIEQGYLLQDDGCEENFMVFIHKQDSCNSDNIKMTVKEFYEKYDTKEVFSIEKGRNRHPSADLLHKWLEGAELEFKSPYDNQWHTLHPSSSIDFSLEYRLKPIEYEYQYIVNISGATFTSKYMTDKEYRIWGYKNDIPSNKDESSKRVRGE